MSKDSSTTETVGSFPLGLRVLLVDDDPTCLQILRSKLRDLCKYEVTPCTRAMDALSLLQEKKDGFDIVLTDLRMPDVDGLQLLESIRSMEMMDQLPVILFSGEVDEDVVTRGIKKGACDFLVKPIQDGTLKMIWQHVLRLKLRKEVTLNCSISEVNQRERSESAIQSSSDNATAHQIAGCSKRKRDLARADQDDEVNDNKGIETGTVAKKPRVTWTSDQHLKFLEAIDIIYKRKNPGKRFSNDGSGEIQAVPKEILEEMQKMGVEGLTRQNISSHLQKHRSNIKKQVESLEQQNTLSDLSCTSSGQCNSLPVELNSLAQAAPYPATHHHHHFLARNFPVDYLVQQPENCYFSGIDQQVGPLPAAQMTQQLMLQHNRPIQSPIWNPGSCLGNIETAPANLQFRPASVNQLTFSPPTEHYQFVSTGPCVYKNEVPSFSNCLQKTAEAPSNIGTAVHGISSFSSNYGTQLYASQQGCKSEILSKQEFAGPTILNEDIGQTDLGALDMSLLDNWIDIEGGKDMNRTLQGLMPPPT